MDRTTEENGLSINTLPTHEPALIDLKKIVQMLLPKSWLIIVIAVVGGLAAYLYTQYLIVPLYTANVTLYIRSSQASTENTESVNYNELAVAQRITNTYIAVLQSDAVLEKVVEKSPVSGDSAGHIRSMMRVSAIEETSIVNVTVTSADPQMAAQMANLIAQYAPAPMAEYIEGSSVRILNYAKVPSGPSSPNVKRNILMGALMGAILSMIGVWIYAMLDIRIKTESDLGEIADIPVLGAVPNFSVGSVKKGGQKL